MMLGNHSAATAALEIIAKRLYLASRLLEVDYKFEAVKQK